MYTLLLFAVLLTVLLQPAVASDPIMNLTPPGSPLDLPYTIHELFLCQLCGMEFGFCRCVYAMPQMPYNDAPPPVHYPAIDPPLPVTRDTDVDLALVWDYVTGDPRPVSNEYIQYMDANETTVQPITVQAHIEDTYTPGDRSSSNRPKSRRSPNRRQAPRERGFVCSESGCNEAFNRQCDLNRHHKTTHRRNERPHVCPTCDRGFLYPKDLRRHERQHSDPSSIMVTFRCEHPDCTNLDGFSRKDNLQRHRRRQHPLQ
jgi:hypothetical protein